jgi:hypothetical protein
MSPTTKIIGKKTEAIHRRYAITEGKNAGRGEIFQAADQQEPDKKLRQSIGRKWNST